MDALEEPTVEKCVKSQKLFDKAAKKTGVNFIGGYTALVHKDYTNGERILIESIPEALACRNRSCMFKPLMWVRQEPVSIWTLLNRWVRLLRERLNLLPIHKDLRAKLVVFCNAVEDNPFMAGAFLGEGEGECYKMSA